MNSMDSMNSWVGLCDLGVGDGDICRVWELCRDVSWISGC